MENQPISEESDRGIDLRRLTRASKLEDLVIKLPTFEREPAASSPVNTARDLGLGDRSMIAVPLSCEDFDEDDWNRSTIAVPLSCEDFDEE